MDMPAYYGHVDQVGLEEDIRHISCHRKHAQCRIEPHQGQHAQQGRPGYAEPVALPDDVQSRRHGYHIADPRDEPDETVPADTPRGAWDAQAGIQLVGQPGQPFQHGLLCGGLHDLTMTQPWPFLVRHGYC